MTPYPRTNKRKIIKDISKEDLDYIFNRLVNDFELNEVKATYYEHNKTTVETVYVIPRITDRTELLCFEVKEDGYILHYYKEEFKEAFEKLISELLYEKNGTNYWS